MGGSVGATGTVPTLPLQAASMANAGKIPNAERIMAYTIVGLRFDVLAPFLLY
jgi:hypothetical protein